MAVHAETFLRCPACSHKVVRQYGVELDYTAVADEFACPKCGQRIRLSSDQVLRKQAQEYAWTKFSIQFSLLAIAGFVIAWALAGLILSPPVDAAQFFDEYVERLFTPAMIALVVVYLLHSRTEAWAYKRLRRGERLDPQR